MPGVNALFKNNKMNQLHKGMSIRGLAAVVGLSLSLSVFASPQPETTSKDANVASQVSAVSNCPAFLDERLNKLNSSEVVDVCQLVANKTVLIVNTASNCGYTPQFKALETLYQTYKDQDFVILGFPSDNFFQEEDDEKDTAKVCYVNYGVTFPMMTTTLVRGSDAHPIFAHLADKTASPYWNFYKYLVSKDGQSIQRFSSKVEPMSEELTKAIEAQL